MAGVRDRIIAHETIRPAYILTVGLQNLSTQYSTDYGGIMAGSVITALPVIIIFAVFQKQFVQTVTGGVKA